MCDESPLSVKHSLQDRPLLKYTCYMAFLEQTEICPDLEAARPNGDHPTATS